MVHLIFQCQPLTDLSKKDTEFDWSPFCRNAFNALKHALQQLLSWLFLILTNRMSLCVMPQALVLVLSCSEVDALLGTTLER